jgi:hypothetical protein
MKILNECTFIKPEGIAKVEKSYNAKYVFESCLKTKDGGWADFPAAIFYTEKPHPEGSNYFAVWHNGVNLLITDALPSTEEPFDALQVGEEIIYSRYRHDYRELGEAMVDGGRDYFRCSTVGTHVKLKVVKDHLEVVDGTN